MPILTSKNNKISKSFYDHHENVEECFKAFTKFIEKLLCDEPDPHQLESLHLAIDSCESDADRTLRYTVDLVHEVFCPLPVPISFPLPKAPMRLPISARMLSVR